MTLELLLDSEATGTGADWGYGEIVRFICCCPYQDWTAGPGDTNVFISSSGVIDKKQSMLALLAIISTANNSIDT